MKTVILNEKEETLKAKLSEGSMDFPTKYGAFSIMGKLVKLIAPFIALMSITISMGILGFLVAIFITVLGGVGISAILKRPILEMFQGLNLSIFLLITFSIARSVLRYLEQYSGHFIAFKVLALIRDKVYVALRRLAPAKLDGQTAGKLISIITADVEQLEVFYAHTIAPIGIAILTSSIMALIIWTLSPTLSFIAIFAYILVGFIIPYISVKYSRDSGRKYRQNVGEINTTFLENLYGMREVILFNQADKRQALIDEKSAQANESVRKLKQHQGVTKAVTDTAILGMSAIMLFSGVYLVQMGSLSFEGFLVSLICLMSSYGPTVALSNLANNLLQTFASGERVLSILEEKPLIEEKLGGSEMSSYGILINNLHFSYKNNQEKVLDKVSIEIKENSITGIMGKSGSGKSTLLKLMMRFYDVSEGDIFFGKDKITKINTASLRKNIAYVTQNTYLFNATIEENIRIAKRDASMEEIIEASKKANFHDFVMTLPEKYQSKVGELGERLSGGEQQRIGLARAFLHDSKIVLLDEVTSNLDSLNESIILSALKSHSQDKTIVLVSHRPSTLSICDIVYHLEGGRVS